MATSLSRERLERELRAIFASPTFDMNEESTKSIRKLLVERLGLEELPSKCKGVVKELVVSIIHEQDDEEDGDDKDDNSDSEEDEGDENEAPPKKARKKVTATKRKKPAPKQKKTTKPPSASSYGSSVQRLLELGQAMRLGPRLHRGLKDMDNDDERIDALTERLEEAGASWKGQLPSPQDVARAKANRQKQDDLEGLDTSLIIEGGRGRRGRSTVNYAVIDNQDDEEEEEEKEENNNNDGEEEDEGNDNANNDNGEEEKRPRKKPKAKKQEEASSDDDDDDDDDEDFGGSQSSDEGAEFD